MSVPMLKFANYSVVFQEIPDETTLSINISNCPCHCPGCHSSYLWADEGDLLNETALASFLEEYGNDITCISFMGGDAEPAEVCRLAKYLHSAWPQYKVAWYSGRQYIPTIVDKQQFDYIKVGPYIEHLGSLKSRTTNQRLLKRQTDGSFLDITSRFWDK